MAGLRLTRLTRAAHFFSWFGLDAAEQSLQQSAEVAKRHTLIQQLLFLREDTKWLLEYRPVLIVTHGAEFTTIYILMLWLLLN